MNKISEILENQLPEFVRADHPTFIAFMEAYYEFCEQAGGTTYTGRNNWDDIDNTLPEFLDFFYKDYLPLFPETMLSDKTLLAKNAKVFYRSKGTEKSFKLLFRALFNEDVDIYYPKNDILKVSGGKWIVSVSLRLTPTNPENFELFKNLSVTGVTSGATALVDSTRIYSAFGTTVYELFVSNVVGEFRSSEEVFGTYVNTDGTTIDMRGISMGVVSSVTIVFGGANNNLGDIVPITGGGGIGASAYVSEVTTGEVVDIDIINPGAGFLVGDQLYFTTAIGDNGSHAAAYVQNIQSFDKQHPDSIYINSDIIGGFANVTLDSLTYSSNLSGTVTVSGNSTVVYGSNTIFLSEVGPNVAIAISGNTRYITNVVNNTYLTVNSAFSSLAETNANVVITTHFADANVNTSIYDALSWNIRYGPCGPVRRIRITNQGANYKLTPLANIAGYVPMRNLGIIGSVAINNGGEGYAVDDELTFTTVDGYGRGCAGYVSAVDANGAITTLTLAYPKITGWGNVASNSSNVIRGTDTEFTTDLVNGDVIHILGQERSVVNIANNTWLTTNTAFSFNALQANVRIGKKDQFIGGVLYNTSPYLPTITVNSVAGVNANLVVASTMAGGENLLPITVAGKITEVTVTNPGIGYTSNVTIDMTNNGDGTAILVGDVIAGAYKYPGRYLDDSNLLNSASKIQERDYYQNFSYVLKSKLSFNRYAEALMVLVHPTGMKAFSETLVESNQDFKQEPDFSIQIGNVMSTEAQNYYDAVTTAGGFMSFNRLNAINTYIVTLKEAGIWETVEEMWLLSGENEEQSLISLRHLILGEAVNSPIFTPNYGYEFDGVTNYVDTKFVPLSDADIVTDGHDLRLTLYDIGPNYSNAGYAIGSYDSAYARLLIRPRSGNYTAFSLNTTIVTSNSTPGLVSFGYTTVSRTLDDDYLFHKNGIDLGGPNAPPAVTGTTLSNRSIYFGGANYVSSFLGPRACKVSFGYLGKSISEEQEMIDYNAVQTLMTAIGCNV